MLQYTRTSPGAEKDFSFDRPLRYSPRSNRFSPETEKTLWKIGSVFGNDTARPSSTARTRGVNRLCSDVMVAGAAGAWSETRVASIQTTTFDASDRGFPPSSRVTLPWTRPVGGGIAPPAAAATRTVASVHFPDFMRRNDIPPRARPRP